MNVFAAPTRVLLVEPHADTRELYDWGLTTAGFDVQTADDGTSAMAALATDMPSVVVSEIRLPDFGALIARCSDAGVPVIALTTNPFSQHAYGAACITAVLLKPCLPDEVGAVIRDVLDARARSG
jgi:two-component system C4-dicarboxylate transport response regulator DctD